ncbi:hypothetical protein AWC38_SpisGene24346 [Stylophora pistillata]|uniref:Uncharacterized protein n=1 Tax=Stylophora pistillata TaxID=50429 RepID=A0A2B4R4S0_STYPI|nr:hypothetical protein AWC38_SpisGene24346 [Stylophora pistillata]
MQLSSLKSITRDNVIFEEAVTNQHGHERINIKIKHGSLTLASAALMSIGAVPLVPMTAEPLVIASPFRFSFGVQPSLNKNGDVTGYTLPTPLWNHQEGEPTQKEFAFYEALKELKHICYEYLDETYGTDVAESIKFPLVEKEGKAPILYPRLMYSQKSGKIRTLFHSKEESKVNPLECLDYCKVKMSIVVDSIYLGDDYASVQLKVNDVYMHRLPHTQPLVIETPTRKFSGLRVASTVKKISEKKKSCEHIGYQLPFPLYPSYSNCEVRKETNFLNALKELKSLCRKHIEKEFGTGMAKRMKFPMSKDHFEKHPIRYLYPTLMYNKDTKEICTPFYTKDDMEYKDLLFYLGKDVKFKMVIVVDCILVEKESDTEDGEVASVQIKVYEVYLENPTGYMMNRFTNLSEVEDKYDIEATKEYCRNSPPPSRHPEWGHKVGKSLLCEVLKKEVEEEEVEEEEVEEEDVEVEVEEELSDIYLSVRYENIHKLITYEIAPQVTNFAIKALPGLATDALTSLGNFPTIKLLGGGPVQNSKINQLVAFKHLLTDKQKKDILTALVSGTDLEIYLTKSQCFNGFLSTLPSNFCSLRYDL